jgi:saccharopine dehydrogenase-like NADP-dependent oxidoreductase
MRVAVLGGGRVGGAIALDLARDAEFQVTVADSSARALERVAASAPVAVTQTDLSEAAAVAQLAAAHDLVVGAVPGHMGFATVKAVLEAGRPIVDISFFPEDPFLLDELARAQGVVAVVDAGVAPGCSNLILGRVMTLLEKTERFVCYVGGLPVERRWPWEYKAPFSPSDVLEEYTRPARLMTGGRVVTVPALSEPELVDFPGIGTLEACVTDGLRTLLVTCSRVGEMREKTLRYPGHFEKMRMLRQMGLFSSEPVHAGDVTVRPIDLTSRLLFPMWELREGEEDVTVMRVIVEGRGQVGRERHTFELLDRYDRASATTSMARTTGFTCTAVVRLLARGLFSRAGMAPLELIGAEPGCYAFVMRELASRGVLLQESVESIP